MAVKTGITLEDLAFMENVYSPPIGALNEPIAARRAERPQPAGGLSSVRFAAWLRCNAEHYLLIAAQQRVAAARRLRAPGAAADAQGPLLPRRLRAGLPPPAVAVPPGRAPAHARQPPAHMGAAGAQTARPGV